MNKQRRIARLIMARLARIAHQHIDKRTVYNFADTLLSWERQYREEWLLARYEDLVKYIGFDDEELAIVLL